MLDVFQSLFEFVLLGGFAQTIPIKRFIIQTMIIDGGIDCCEWSPSALCTLLLGASSDGVDGRKSEMSIGIGFWTTNHLVEVFFFTTTSLSNDVTSAADKEFTCSYPGSGWSQLAYLGPGPPQDQYLVWHLKFVPHFDLTTWLYMQWVQRIQEYWVLPEGLQPVQVLFLRDRKSALGQQLNCE